MGIIQKGGKKFNLQEFRTSLQKKLGLPPPSPPQESLQAKVQKMVDAGFLDQQVLDNLDTLGSLSKEERKKLVRETRLLFRAAKERAYVQVHVDWLRDRLEDLVGREVLDADGHRQLEAMIVEAAGSQSHQESRRLIGEIKDQMEKREKLLRATILKHGKTHRISSPYKSILAHRELFKTYAEFEEALVAYYKNPPQRWFYGMKNVESVTFDRFGVSVFDSPEHFFHVVTELQAGDLSRLKGVASKIAGAARQIIQEDSIGFLWQKQYVVEDILQDYETTHQTSYSVNERLVIKMFVHRFISDDNIEVTS